MILQNVAFLPMDLLNTATKIFDAEASKKGKDKKMMI